MTIEYLQDAQEIF